MLRDSSNQAGVQSRAISGSSVKAYLVSIELPCIQRERGLSTDGLGLEGLFPARRLVWLFFWIRNIAPPVGECINRGAGSSDVDARPCSSPTAVSPSCGTLSGVLDLKRRQRQRRWRQGFGSRALLLLLPAA